MNRFKLISPFTPAGDQPKAIQTINKNLVNGVKYQTLLGITGSGKTFTIANVIARQNRTTLVMAPNKTLAAQLFSEFKEFFPENKVRYFVSYYDYYQPEAYVPSTDTFIEKDSRINEEIDKMRHAATTALLESNDVIIVSSVSCIYGLGAPEEYLELMVSLKVGDFFPREDLARKLVELQYKRISDEFGRGTFRVRGEVFDIFPSDEDEKAYRITFFGDQIESIFQIDSITGKKFSECEFAHIYPVSHFVTSQERVKAAIESIKQELKARVRELLSQGKALEAQRLENRTMYDLELLSEMGFCPGVENYSRHLAGRKEGETPTTLLDYLPDDFLLVIDESHVMVPQIGGMFRGDRARKMTLVEHGFRLPSALDNRPLTAEEFWAKTNQVIFVSATPGEYELEKSGEYIIEQINRPTGLLDPVVTIRPALNQVDDLLTEIRKTVESGDRVLVTTLTKKMAEDLAEYIRNIGIKCRYLHSEINAIDRVEILRGLRKGEFDVLIGINLLREGLDLVEVALVAILDADKEGFLRSERSLIQTIGRAARNIKGRAILYADKITDSIEKAVSETNRRRKLQDEFNRANGIIPRSARSEIQRSLLVEDPDRLLEVLPGDIPTDQKAQLEYIENLRKEMFNAAKNREFERAAELRDLIINLEKLLAS
jgi:excinuclease ABC subunit B